LATAQQLAPDILQHIARLHDQDQESDQQQLAMLETGYRQCQQRRHVRHAIDGDHQAPLHFGDPPHELRSVAAQRRHDRQQ
jgi:hypothetical protein